MMIARKTCPKGGWSGSGPLEIEVLSFGDQSVNNHGHTAGVPIVPLD
jgi:hypothetical protein